MSSVSAWYLASRPKTLPASISPILLGSALAWQKDEFQWLVFALALVCALALQIAVNLANDFFDAKSGVDGEQRLGPMRATQSGMISAIKMQVGLILVTLSAVLAGLGLVMLSDLWILFFGLLSVVAVFAYSAGPFALASHALGEVTVLVFFGWLAVGGTFYVHTQQINWVVLAYGTTAGLLSAAIMLVNNLRDIPTDGPAGKMTLAVLLGEVRSRQCYIGLLIATLVTHLVVSIPISIFTAVLPIVILSPIAYRLSVLVLQLKGAELNKLLANTAKLLLAYCVLCSFLLASQ